MPLQGDRAEALPPKLFSSVTALRDRLWHIRVAGHWLMLFGLPCHFFPRWRNAWCNRAVSTAQPRRANPLSGSVYQWNIRRRPIGRYSIQIQTIRVAYCQLVSPFWGCESIVSSSEVEALPCTGVCSVSKTLYVGGGYPALSGGL